MNKEKDQLFDFWAVRMVNRKYIPDTTVIPSVVVLSVKNCGSKKARICARGDQFVENGSKRTTVISYRIILLAIVISKKLWGYRLRARKID